MRTAGSIIALVVVASLGSWGMGFGDEPTIIIEPLDIGKSEAAPAAPYDPRTTAVLMNLCRESLCKIVNYNDRVVLDEEYSRLANNIDVTLIRDDEIAALIQKLMIELNALRLDEDAKAQIVGYYERKLNLSILDAIKPPKELLRGASDPILMACKAILLTSWGTTNRAKALSKYNKELAEKVVALRADELKRLAELRTAFFGTEYALYKRYGLPDRLNIKEVQLEQYIRVIQDEDPGRRLERLERLKEDFEAYPPFWYQIGLAAQEAGNNTLALVYYRRFDETALPMLREDPDRVAVCMHRIMLLDPVQDRAAILRDLETIERNTRYYYRWENMLFAALTYYALGDVDNARRLIRTSINEGCSVPLHEQVLVEMESVTARARLEGTRLAMVSATEGIAFDRAMQVGRARSLDTLRALGGQITGIALDVQPRNQTAQKAALAVPGYNVYLLGREAFKGDVYFDNVVARIPAAWFSGDKPHVSLKFNGKTIKPADKTRDKATGDVIVTFPRVFDRDDVLAKGRVYPCALKLEDDHGEMELGYEIHRVDAETLRFELRTIEYMGESYQLEHGLIVRK